MKNLKPGNAIAFGSAFKVPTVLYIDLPDPMPLSNNVDLESVWYEKEQPADQATQTAGQASAPVAAGNDVSSMMAQQAAQQTFTQPQAAPAAPQPQMQGTFIQQPVQTQNTGTQQVGSAVAATPALQSFVGQQATSTVI